MLDRGNSIWSRCIGAGGIAIRRKGWSRCVGMCSTNSLERLIQEIKRRTGVVGIFPNEAAIVRLVSAILMEQNDEWQL